MKKNNSGFTLVELLAIVLIITIIALTATYAVFGYFKSSRDKACKVTITTIEESARAYLMIPGNEKKTAVSLEELANEGLIESKIINPQNNKELTTAEMKKTVKITYTASGDKGKYTFEVPTEVCNPEE